MRSLDSGVTLDGEQLFLCGPTVVELLVHLKHEETNVSTQQWQQPTVTWVMFTSAGCVDFSGNWCWTHHRWSSECQFKISRKRHIYFQHLLRVMQTCSDLFNQVTIVTSTSLNSSTPEPSFSFRTLLVCLTVWIWNRDGPMRGLETGTGSWNLIKVTADIHTLTHTQCSRPNNTGSRWWWFTEMHRPIGYNIWME